MDTWRKAVMHAFTFPRRLLLGVTLSFGAALAFGQTQTTAPFEPQVGQPGKDVVWVPTPQATVDKMLDLAEVTPEDYVIDLGSGDGRTVISAAKRGARALGIEYDQRMVDLSVSNAAAEGVSGRATFRKADLFETDFSQATVITMFLLPSINLQLRPKILAMKPGTRVASNTFTMDDWKADEVAEITPCESWCTVHFWIVPANVEGTWESPAGRLTLQQTFQNITGKLGDADISDGKLRGDRISFAANGSRYTGRVSDNRITGTVASSAQTGAWQATRQAR
jgi:hypothetical protein